MKRLYIVLIGLFIFPIFVNAETYTYNICKSGCEYNDLASVREEISTKDEDSDIVINFMDSETYEGNETYHIRATNWGILNSVTINGNDSKMILDILSIYSHKIFIDDITIVSSFVQLSSTNSNDMMPDEINNQLYLQNNIDLNNVKVQPYNSNSAILVQDATVMINNSIFDVLFASTTAEVFADSSTFNEGVTVAISYGSFALLTKVYLYSSNTINGSIIRKNYNIDNLFNNNVVSTLSVPGNLSEFDVSSINEISSFITEYNITADLNNYIYYYQDIDKAIKTNTNISGFESEFVNTYENSEGYDDIKDNPVDWKSEDESIAKIENGTIAPLKAGKVDIVGTRNNDIYTIHLTVEKETIPEKIDKMSIKVPITGNKIKAWVVVVSVLLLVIIGTCSYMLVKRKK